jgi:hypothetical membrane protein
MKSFLIRGATQAGLFTPLWFVALVVLQGALNPGYSHVALPISALAAFDTGWIQNLNFYVSGALLAVFTVRFIAGSNRRAASA